MSVVRPGDHAPSPAAEVEAREMIDRATERLSLSDGATILLMIDGWSFRSDISGTIERFVRAVRSLGGWTW